MRNVVMGRSVIAGILGCAGLAATASAQFDNSVWPGFKGTAEKQASVAADGPAVNHALTVNLTEIGTVTPGGITVASNGDIYCATHTNLGFGTTIYRINGDTGAILATNDQFDPNPAGNFGNYGGVAVGTDAVYACVHKGAPNTKIVKMNKTTLNTIVEFTDGAWGGLRGTPLIGNKKNVNGNVNLYVVDRDNTKIYAVDSVTGQTMWTYSPIYSVTLGQMGPIWTDAGTGKDRVAYFGNGDLGPGAVLEDNGDSSFNIVWDASGPGNFNWFGSGAMASDGSGIYVTTFNDNFTPSLWKINPVNGAVIWSVDGQRGICGEEFNFFGRPAVRGNRVYCAGGAGVIACFQDNGSSYTEMWEYRDNNGENTAVSVAETSSGDVYVYAVRQELAPPIDPINDPCGPSTLMGIGELTVVKDNGASFSMVTQTTLSGAMRNTIFGNNSATIDADGSLWVAGGRYDATTPGQIYKFDVGSGCYADCDLSGSLDFFDFLCFQNAFANADPYADCDNSGSLDFFDFLCFQNMFAAGCP